MSILFIRPTHLLSEPRYEVDCTFWEAQAIVATPWNRITIIPGILPSTLRASFNCLNRSRRFIPRRCAPCMDAQVSQAQDVQERPSTCTPQNAHSTPSNHGV